MLRCLYVGVVKPSGNTGSHIRLDEDNLDCSQELASCASPSSLQQLVGDEEAQIATSGDELHTSEPTSLGADALAASIHSSSDEAGESRTEEPLAQLAQLVVTEPNTSPGSVIEEASPEGATDSDVACSASEDNNPGSPVLIVPKNNRAKPSEKYSIRLVPCVDHSLTLPFHYAPPVERRTNTSTIIRVGRLNSNTDTTNESEMPIVFKSKVVSRTHAELQCLDGDWYIRDLQSSSGTFLNNARLSEPNKASAPCKLSNGDIVQLGLNFRGGAEEVFQAVRVRVELNYSWHRQISEYNVETLKKLKSQVLKCEDQRNLQECSICLEGLGPRQPLFIAPCSHGWHYRCIRPLLVRFYPHFSCPNCRDVFNLEDELSDEEDQT